jgi:serine protease
MASPLRVLPILCAAGALALPCSAQGASFVPGEVLVQYEDGTSGAERVDAQEATGTKATEVLPGGGRKLEIRDGEGVRKTVEELEAQNGVESAHPNYRARASAFLPNDPGFGAPGDWRRTQWNFAGPFGVRAPEAWAHMRALGKPGGKGVRIAVIDTGIAYRNKGRFKRAPDLARARFVQGHDWVDDDGFALDEEGHGTHITGTIAEQVNNRRALTGLAYGASIMPLRVLDSAGYGDAGSIARAIRYAARRGAKVINMSFEFDAGLTEEDVPNVASALEFAHKAGVVVVAAAGNDGPVVAYPARADHAISAGSTTEDGCQAEYSNGGNRLDLVAPGGGTAAPNLDNPWDLTHCKPIGGSDREIYQETFSRGFRRFGLRPVHGTSMSSPHIAAAAALVIASGVLGPNPRPDAVEARLEATARDVGPAGRDTRYGHGLLDVAAAVGAG